MDGEVIKDIVFQGFGGGGDDDVICASLPSVGEEFVKHTSVEFVIRGKDSNVLASSTKNFMKKVSGDGFTSAAGDADEFHVTDWVAVVTI